MNRKPRANGANKSESKSKKRPLGSKTVQRERSTPPALSQIDRFEALIRHPQFQKERRELEGLLPSNDLMTINKVCAFKTRWGLGIYFELRAADWMDKTRRIIIQEGQRVFLNDAIQHGLSLGVSKESVIRDEVLCGTGLGQNFIWMRINLQHPLTTLVDHFKAIVTQRKSDCEFKDRRMREHQVSIWEVWDKHKIGGKSLLTIAQEECGIRKSPAYSPEVKRVFESIKLAYAKAEKILGEITPR